jgi:hypothetical protein
MVSLQEELDWCVYRDYGLIGDDAMFKGVGLPNLQSGERAFAIVMGRQVAAGDLETTWFKRHNASMLTEIPSHLCEEYGRVVDRRIQLIESDVNIRLLEQPEYKRRWNVAPWDIQQERVLRTWLASRLETDRYWSRRSITTIAKLADVARQDLQFTQVAEVLRGPEVDVISLVSELVEMDAVPHLSVLRHTDSGLRKRAQWESVWELQRQEDAIASPSNRREISGGLTDIPVPPKYLATDFRRPSYWRARGKLDVPKERFISYPGCERAADGSLPIAWVGLDHAQQARALGAYYMQIKTEEGTVQNKLVPLLAGLLELLPWIRQWHGGTDPEFGLDLGDYYASFVDTEARALGFTVEQIRAWKPESKAKKGKKSKQA